mmetsp:Transcript_10126/g.18917  ORF Transcript_10126/g.18917 Transcript_10126/m.18917 type:complete len:625 (+) Transcript_10126:165-2039(+)
MATSFTLNMNEDVLFKHPSSMKSLPGMLYLTTLRVTWIASSSSQSAKNLLLPWTQIQDDKYSKSTDEKQRCMIRLTSVHGDAHVFSLTGAPPSSLRDELERAKVAVKRGRQGGEAKKPPVVKTTQGSKHSTSGTGTTQLPPPMLTTGERREQLLAADAELRRLHKELVGEGVIGEDEFWTTRSKLVSDSEGRDVATRKGMTSSLLSDVEHAEMAGKGSKFQLTPEAVMDIFQMYPAVLEEYNAKVPLEMTKDEFWVKYFQHEVFTKSSRGSASRVKLPLETRAGVSKSDAEAGQPRKVSDRVSSEMDLTLTFGDYHVAEKLDPEDSHFKSTNTAAKYKRKGSLVLEQQQQSHAGEGITSTSSGGDDLAVSSARNRERSWETNAYILNEERPGIDDIPLHLNRKKRIRVEDSAGEPRILLTEGDMKCFALNHQENAASAGVSGGRYQGVFPSSASAITLLKKEQEKLSKFTEVARQAADLEGGGSSLPVGTLGGTGSTTAEQWNIGVSSIEHMQTTPELERYIRGQFKHVSELLVHFYVSIAHSSRVDAASYKALCEKNLRIQKKLEENLDALQKKKNWVKANAGTVFPSNGKHLLGYTFKYFKEISDLIYRAFDYWENYQCSHS